MVPRETWLSMARKRVRRAWVPRGPVCRPETLGSQSRLAVMARLSLGELLASKGKDAYGCINSKRVDFALMEGAVLK